MIVARSYGLEFDSVSAPQCASITATSLPEAVGTVMIIQLPRVTGALRVDRSTRETVGEVVRNMDSQLEDRQKPSRWPCIS